MTYTINQLAKIAGITRRSLHHYDAIGLLQPKRQQRNDYRQYGEEDLLRLQQILFFRELGFPLERIKEIMTSPGYNILEALEDQKKLLRIESRRLQRLVETINKTIDKMKGIKNMPDEDLYEDFNQEEMDQYQAEAKERWGNTEAWRQSQERTKHWTKEDYKRIAAESKAHTQKIATAMDKGISDPEVQELIAQSHQGINIFYDCSPEMFRNLGEMYVTDPRFTAHYEKFRPGLAIFMRDAIAYYCDHHKK